MRRPTDNSPLAAPLGESGRASGPVYEAVARLAERHATGVLRIGPDQEIWLADGLVTLAVCPSSPDLARVLVDAGIGTEVDLRAMIDGRRADDGLRSDVVDHQAGEARTRNGLEALFDANPHQHDRLLRLLHEYKLAALFDLLVIPEDDADFVDGLRHPLGDRFGEHALDLLDKAEARVALWRRIAARVPSTAARFRMSPDLPADAQGRALTADEWRYLAILDGRSTVADVIHDTGHSAFRVCSALYRLLLEELIVEVPATGSPTSP